MKPIQTVLSICLILVSSILFAATNPTKKQYIHWLEESCHTSSSNDTLASVFSQYSLQTIAAYQTEEKDCVFFTLYTTTLSGQTFKAVGLLNHFIPLNELPAF